MEINKGSMFTEEFDKDLKEIVFYKIHEEYLPYIGVNYKNQKHKFLIIAESHYINHNKWDWGKEQFNKWWEKDWQEILSENKEEIDYFNTRKHFGNGIENKERAMPVMINNMNRVLFNETDNVNFRKNVSFMNYYQFPSLENGISFWQSIKDKTNNIESKQNRKEIRLEIWNKVVEESNRVVDSVIDIIKPSLVIFTSISAYDAYVSKNGRYKDQVKCTCHSSCSWWHRPMKRFGGNTGEQQFEHIIKEYMNND